MYHLVDPRYRVFGVMAGSIVLVGGLVGGVVGILLPQLSTGLVLGTVAGLLACMVNFSYQYFCAVHILTPTLSQILIVSGLTAVLQLLQVYIFVVVLTASIVSAHYFEVL